MIIYNGIILHTFFFENIRIICTNNKAIFKIFTKITSCLKKSLAIFWHSLVTFPVPMI
ncbi:hypothetical protein CJJ81176_1324 [Campylobacter jejuni subsp. jejuni 81-176]|uniref:Uncharacterized protein n=1 Tax=Campylobacter jejuni subsp. jejuni serotype O:23/36 (strain 81-176) TaxID=354242 RepID=A0A0H3P9U5_CAMJJ|nr:hypothetical protein CJJ81176_1324 [Campylobacter jejuni subsp. jejuni 81-176]